MISFDIKTSTKKLNKISNSMCFQPFLLFSFSSSINFRFQFFFVVNYLGFVIISFWFEYLFIYIFSRLLLRLNEMSICMHWRQHMWSCVSFCYFKTLCFQFIWTFLVRKYYWIHCLLKNCVHFARKHMCKYSWRFCLQKLFHFRG